MGTRDWQITLPAGSDRRCPANFSCGDSLRGEPAIEGYAWPASARHQENISFYVSTTEPAYTFAIYRLGWYGGDGGREVMRLALEGTPQGLPSPLAATGRVECQWTPALTITIPPSWVSGVYLVKLTADSSGQQSYIPFVVRDDERRAELLVQCSVTTWQAYNCWGGKSLYDFNSVACARANEVSFLRPYANGDGAGELFYFEINLIRWLESEGYDVSYCTNLDVHNRSERIARHKAFISSGHDEYWSNPMRDHVEEARDRGIHLAFLTANACYWQVRLEPGMFGEDGTTMVCYKGAAPTADPLALDIYPANDSLVTVHWRDEPVRKPEARLIGIMFDEDFIVTPPSSRNIVITSPSHWIFEGTGAVAGTVLPGLLGNEMDRWYPAESPPGIEILAESPVLPPESPDSSAHMTLYQPQGSPALVFAAGTLQWSWGLDDYTGFFHQTPRVSEIARQATRNLLARFLASPLLPLDVEGRTVITQPRAWPMPFTPGRTPLRMTFAYPQAAGPARVYDLAGRPVTTLEWSSDARELRWDGRDLRGLAVTPGIYWVTAGRHRVRVVVTR